MPAIGSSKRKKRKANSSAKGLAGLASGSILTHLMYIVLVLVMVGGVVYYYEAIKPADYMGQALAEIKSTGKTALISGKELGPDEQLGGGYEVIGVPSYAMPADAITEMDASKLLAATTIPKGTILTKSNTYNPAAMAIDESAVDYSIRNIIEFDWLNDGDYIDIRLARFRDDNNKAVDDMVVIAKKRITISENRKFISVPLTEKEIKLLKTAEVEKRVADVLGKSTPYNIEIYVTVYTEPGNQKPSIVTYSPAGIGGSDSTNASDFVSSLEELLKSSMLNEDITFDVVENALEGESTEDVGASEEQDETEGEDAEALNDIEAEESSGEENFEDVIEDEEDTVNPEGRG